MIIINNGVAYRKAHIHIEGGIRMMSSLMKKPVRALILSCAFLLFLAGCSSNSNNDNSSLSASPAASASPSASASASAPAASSETQYPITIKHAFGETVIESKPERVATIAWSNHNVALALNVVPVGFSAANYGVIDDSGMLPWTAQKLQELGAKDYTIFQDTAGLDFEAIANVNPDVILAAYSGITAEEYATLSKIAPVVAYPKDPWVITWRDQVTMNAAGMGMAAEGEQLIKNIESYISDISAKYPDLKGKKIAFASFSAADLSSYYIYTPADPRAGFLLELGMEYPESVLGNVTSESGFYLQLSAENADALSGAEALVMYGDQALLDALQKDPMYSQVPAIKNGAVALIGDNTPLAAAANPDALSLLYTTDEYVSLIDAAIKKAQ